MDRNLGTNYFDHGYFRNAAMFRVQSVAPGLKESLRYGDDSGGLGIYNFPIFSPVWYHQDANEYAFIDALVSSSSGSFLYPWMIYACNPGSRPEMGSIDVLPKKVYFPDMDMAFMRDGWDSTDVAALFKCSVFGGKDLNEYRDENDFSYINVAHDDPDANSFILYKSGELVAATDGYSYSKKSANHNTILVDGVGQYAPGRSEGGQWTQPSNASETMTNMAYVTAWDDDGDIAFIEGEASGSYTGSALTRYRRSFIWNEGKYVLVFDDIRASESEELTWLMQSGAISETNSSEGRFEMTRGSESLDFQVVSTSAFTASVVDSPSDQRNTSLGLRQLRLVANASEVQFASVYALWDGELTVAYTPTDANSGTITVTGDGFVDTWTWQAATDSESASSFSLTSSDTQAYASMDDPVGHFFEQLTYRVGDWMENSWFGWIHTDAYPWVYSDQHGWLYCGSSVDGDIFLWNFSEQTWWYTEAGIYPWVYSFSDSVWELK
jgi:hypothetical protein